MLPEGYEKMLRNVALIARDNEDYTIALQVLLLIKRLKNDDNQ